MTSITALYVAHQNDIENSDSELAASISSFFRSFPSGNIVILTKHHEPARGVNASWISSRSDQIIVVPYTGSCNTLAWCHGLAYCTDSYVITPQYIKGDAYYTLQELINDNAVLPVVALTSKSNPIDTSASAAEILSQIAFHSSLFEKYQLRRATPEGVKNWLTRVIDNEEIIQVSSKASPDLKMAS